MRAGWPEHFVLSSGDVVSHRKENILKCGEDDIKLEIAPVMSILHGFYLERYFSPRSLMFMVF